MRAGLALLGLLLLAGCAGGSSGSGGEPAAAERQRPVVPGWLDGEHRDGTIAFRHPGWWEESESERWGTLISDNRSRHPAFAAVQYLPERTYDSHAEFADVAARTLRPPEGRGLTLLYTQTAILDGRRGIEATFMWATSASTPIGPTMRTLGFPLGSGRVLFLVLAAERPSYHAGQFGWLLKTFEWAPQPSNGLFVHRAW